MMSKYEAMLIADNQVVESATCEDDEHLFMALGRWAMFYFLAFDAVDYKDAYHTMSPLNCPPDAILAFTCDKETDKVDGPHRHGQPKGKLGYGYVWIDGKKTEMAVIIERD